MTLREKVARAIAGRADRYGAEEWRRHTEEADAAIAAVLDRLDELNRELPHNGGGLFPLASHVRQELIDAARQEAGR